MRCCDRRVTGDPRMLAVLLAAGLMFPACSDADARSDGSESLSAPHHDLVEVFRLGGAEPAEPEMFDRAPSLLVDGADRVYIMHNDRGEVAVFDRDGEFMHWISGGRGDGPGEFTWPGRMGLVGDTLWIRNQSPPRISRFHVDGAHLGTESVQIEAAHPTTAGVQGVSGYLEGGRVWVEPDGFPLPMMEAEAPRSTFELAGRASHDSPRDTVLSWRSNRGRLRGLFFDPIPEPPFFSVASDGSGVVVAEWSPDTPASLVLRLIDPDGTERWRRELSVTPQTVSSTEHDSLVAEGRENVRVLREGLMAQGLPPTVAPDVPTEAEARASIYLPTHRPPVREIRHGVDGTIWLELSEDDEGARWLALDPDSGPLLTVTLPAEARFREATQSSLWYTEQDDLGVPWVVRASFAPSVEQGAR